MSVPMRDGRYAAGGTMADKLNGIRLRLCAVVWELEAILPLAQARVSWQEEYESDFAGIPSWHDIQEGKQAIEAGRAVISRVRGES